MNNSAPASFAGLMMSTSHLTQNVSTFPPSVLITGGATGIGRATAIRFINEGWNVILIGRRLAPLQEMERLHPGRILTATCDITRASDVETLLQSLSKGIAFGERLSALVNCAGIYERKSFKETSDEVWTTMFETHILGAVRITRGVLGLLEKNKGVIVNVSSTLGLRPVPQTSAYSAMKAAMVNWTQALALEVAPQGVRANCVCPGIVDTPIHDFHSQSPEEKSKTLGSLANLQPLGRVGRPEDVAHAIWSLCGPGSEWMTGSVLTVDGGINLV